MAVSRSPKPFMGVRIPLPLLRSISLHRLSMEAVFLLPKRGNHLQFPLFLIRYHAPAFHIYQIPAILLSTSSSTAKGGSFILLSLASTSRTVSSRIGSGTSSLPQVVT